MSKHTEAEILSALASNPSWEEAQRLDAELQAIREARREARFESHDIDLANSIVRDHLTAVRTHERHTTDTDWLGDTPTYSSKEASQGAYAEATVWFAKVSSAVKEDREEFTEQARGAARRHSGQYGESASVAYDAFLRHAMQLNKMAVGDVIECPECGNDVGPADGGEEARHAPGCTAKVLYDGETGKQIIDIATCGYCGRSWNDATITGVTPTPAGRCPFEYEHEYDGYTAARRTAADAPMGENPGEGMDRDADDQVSPTNSPEVFPTFAPLRDPINEWITPEDEASTRVDQGAGEVVEARRRRTAGVSYPDFSGACNPGGDGQCNGFKEDGAFCDCPCHNFLNLSEASSAEVAAWHQNYWAQKAPNGYIESSRRRTAEVEQDTDQSGYAESTLPNVSVGDPGDKPMWPWEIGEADGFVEGGDTSDGSGTGAADVADVPTPGDGVGYPQPTTTTVDSDVEEWPTTARRRKTAAYSYQEGSRKQIAEDDCLLILASEDLLYASRRAYELVDSAPGRTYVSVVERFDLGASGVDDDGVFHNEEGELWLADQNGMDLLDAAGIAWQPVEGHGYTPAEASASRRVARASTRMRGYDMFGRVDVSNEPSSSNPDGFPWTVASELGEPLGMLDNNKAQRLVRKRCNEEGIKAKYDSEYGGFWAYCKTREDAEAMAEIINDIIAEAKTAGRRRAVRKTAERWGVDYGEGDVDWGYSSMAEATRVASDYDGAQYVVSDQGDRVPVQQAMDELGIVAEEVTPIYWDDTDEDTNQMFARRASRGSRRPFGRKQALHYAPIEDEDGDLVDLVPFCCDACHRDWCDNNGVAYGGWYGANEGGDSPEWCANCGVRCWTGLDTECDDDCLPVQVNVVSPVPGECPHGYPNWIAPEKSALASRRESRRSFGRKQAAKTLDHVGPCHWLVERENPLMHNEEALEYGWYPDSREDMYVTEDCGAPCRYYTDGSFECDNGHRRGTLEEELGEGGYEWQRDQQDRYASKTANSEVKCSWFAGCNNDADGCVKHPVLGWVPTCRRCADRLDLDLQEGDFEVEANRRRVAVDSSEYQSQAARDAAAMGYGDESYWQYLDRQAQETYDYFMARGDSVRAEQQFTRSLSEALQGNDGE